MIIKLMNWLVKMKLEFIVFFSGAMCMILEMVGSRVVSPYFGNSLVVWTSLIGVILGCLSFGYYYGGKWADKNPSFSVLSKLLLLGALSLGVSAFLKEQVLAWVQLMIGSDIRAGSFFSVLLLFGPVSVIFGMISPFAARIRVESLKNSGQTVGTLYALSTFGSIAGTFLAGFYLIPKFGNRDLLYGLSFGVLALSLLADRSAAIKKKTLIFILIFSLVFTRYTNVFRLNVLEDIDSQYNRILVRQVFDHSRDRIIGISTDNAGIQSAFYPARPDELYFNYLKSYRAYEEINPDVRNALMIGGGGFSFPRYFINRSPDNSMDVVEIDPVMTELARKYFLLKDNSNLSIFHQDARIFLNESSEKYDCVFLDAFNSLTPPSHLTTKEFMLQINNHLNDNGFVMINLISSLIGNNSAFLHGEVDTLKTVFPFVEVYRVDSNDDDRVQNFMVVGFKKSNSNKLSMGNPISLPKHRLSVFTDDWSPIEYLTRRYY